MQSQSQTEIPRTVLQNQCAEDPRRAPLEKETTLTLDGDREQIAVESFKKSVFTKLLQRPHFEIHRLSVRDGEGQETTVDALDKVVSDPSLTIIGVAGHLPVGAVSIGTPRNSNSHADIVK